MFGDKQILFDKQLKLLTMWNQFAAWLVLTRRQTEQRIVGHDPQFRSSLTSQLQKYYLFHHYQSLATFTQLIILYLESSFSPI